MQHARLRFQREQVAARIQLTAYTGVAAFNIGFGARTACSAFLVFPKASWKPELPGQAFRKLEDMWSSVVLLIVDEVSFIARAFFARMHYRLQQAKRGFFSEAALDPNDHTFGDIPVVLVGTSASWIRSRIGACAIRRQHTRRARQTCAISGGTRA